MNPIIRRKIVSYMASAAIGLGVGVPVEASCEAAGEQTALVDDFMLDLEEDGFGDTEEDRDSERLAERFFARLANDRSDPVRVAATEDLVVWLASVDGVTRVRVVSDWALSADPSVRLMMARALASGFYTPVAEVAIEHLSRDSSARVRRAAAVASGVRFSDNPRVFAGVLSHLVSDENRLVSRTSRQVSVELANRMKASAVHSRELRA